MRTATRWTLAVTLAAAATLPTAAMAAGTPGTTGNAGGGQDRLADAAVRAVRSHAAATRVGAHQAFRVTDVMQRPSGASDVRMERTYRGLAVRGGDMVVHRGAAGRWLGVSRTLASAPSFSTSPSVSRAAAARTATHGAAVRDIAGMRVASTTLVVDALDRAPVLAWEVTSGGTHADGTPSRLVTHVDARDGAVLDRAEEIETADGSGQSLYGGTVPLSITPVSGGYQLRDPGREKSYTTDMGNASDSYSCQLTGRKCSAGTIFTSTDTLFGNGSTSSRESAAADAHYGSQETYDFYFDSYGRHGIFNGKAHAAPFNRVHYGKNYVNAFWDGSKMTYGDGDGTSYGPLVSLDVAGHEMSHGVTENSANLTYSGESGGLNESTSDIFGTLVEFYANNAKDPGDYLIGEQFDYAKHVGFRRMDNPASDGSSANCWSSSVGSLDVHYSSGVGNHFFYLLTQGSGAKTLNGVSYNSPTCDGSTVTGIGNDAAGRIWYRALTTYMTSSTDYHGARTASLQAASDLYGAASTQYNAVNAAWKAVNVS